MIFTLKEAAKYLHVKPTLLRDNMTGAGNGSKTLAFDADVSEYGKSGKCTLGRFHQETLDRWQAERPKRTARKSRRRRAGVVFVLFMPSDETLNWRLLYPEDASQITAVSLYVRWQSGRLPYVQRKSPSDVVGWSWPLQDGPITLYDVDKEVTVIIGERENMIGQLIYVAPGNNDDRAALVRFKDLGVFRHQTADLAVRIPGSVVAFTVPKMFV